MNYKYVLSQRVGYCYLLMDLNTFSTAVRVYLGAGSKSLSSAVVLPTVLALSSTVGARFRGQIKLQLTLCFHCWCLSSICLTE